MPFDEKYFSSHTYQDVSFSRFSQYWWSNRFYALLAKRYGSRGTHLLEIGSGLGHLVGQLDHYFMAVAGDINLWALRRSREVAQAAHHVASDAGWLPYADDTFDLVITKHVVEHLQDPAGAIKGIGRVTRLGGILILSTPNLSSLLKPLKGTAWIGYQDPTHISLKPPQTWLELIRSAGFEVLHVFSDGFWDVPYVRWFPKTLQKLVFGSLGGLQAILGLPFLPMRWGESIIVIARKLESNEKV